MRRRSSGHRRGWGRAGLCGSLSAPGQPRCYTRWRAFPGPPRQRRQDCSALRAGNESLRARGAGLLAGCAPPFGLCGRGCAPSAGCAGVRGSGPSLFLGVWGWACLRAGYLCRVHPPPRPPPPPQISVGRCLPCFQVRNAQRLDPALSPSPGHNLVGAVFRAPLPSEPQPGASLPRSSTRFGGAGFSIAVRAAGGGAAAWAGGGRCSPRKGAELG